MIVQVSTATYIKSELLLDTDGDAVTTKINGDWTKTATLLGVGTTATPTITHRATGHYDILCTFPVIGVWSVEYSVVVDGDTIPFEPLTVQVQTAAQIDPVAALSTLIAALPDSADIAALPSTADIVAALSAISVTVASPVAASGDITLYRGDAYADVDDRTIPWSVTGAVAAAWPDLTDADITLFATHQDTPSVTLIATGTITTATGSTRDGTIEVLSAQTIDLLDGDYDCSIVATLDGERPITMIAATLTVVGGGRPVRRR